jgi:hypothetical protein
VLIYKVPVAPRQIFFFHTVVDSARCTVALLHHEARPRRRASMKASRSRSHRLRTRTPAELKASEHMRCSQFYSRSTNAPHVSRPFQKPDQSQLRLRADSPAVETWSCPNAFMGPSYDIGAQRWPMRN